MGQQANNMKQGQFFQIKVKGKLNESWSEWFNGMTIAYKTGEDGVPVTILTGPVADQTALHGLLNKIRDLGLKLVSVEQL
jgi:hypothetical protein